MVSATDTTKSISASPARCEVSALPKEIDQALETTIVSHPQASMNSIATLSAREDASNKNDNRVSSPVSLDKFQQPLIMKGQLPNGNHLGNKNLTCEISDGREKLGDLDVQILSNLGSIAGAADQPPTNETLRGTELYSRDSPVQPISKSQSMPQIDRVSLSNGACIKQEKKKSNRHSRNPRKEFPGYSCPPDLRAMETAVAKSGRARSNRSRGSTSLGQHKENEEEPFNGRRDIHRQGREFRQSASAVMQGDSRGVQNDVVLVTATHHVSYGSTLGVARDWLARACLVQDALAVSQAVDGIPTYNSVCSLKATLL
jgi:transcription elongation factor